jgi:hypothetical protein
MPPKVPPLHQQSGVSGYSREQVAAFLTTPLNADQLRLIGEISTLWNSVQSRLQYFVWQVAEWRGGVGPLVTTDLPAAALFTLAKNMVDNRVKNDFARECADATIDLFDELRAIRNKVIHGLPVVGLDGTVQEFFDLTAKKGRGLKLSTYQVSTPELTTLLDDLGLLAVAIEGVILQIATLAHYQESWPWSLQHGLEVAMLLPISHVQERQAALHRQRSNTDKPQPQPQPSGG